jgi:hypothetical protein
LRFLPARAKVCSQGCAQCGHTKSDHAQPWCRKSILLPTPDYPAALGAQIVFQDCWVDAKILGTFVYRARQLDLRAIEKFKLKTLSQIPGPRVVTK